MFRSGSANRRDQWWFNLTGEEDLLKQVSGKGYHCKPTGSWSYALNQQVLDTLALLNQIMQMTTLPILIFTVKHLPILHDQEGNGELIVSPQNPNSVSDNNFFINGGGKLDSEQLTYDKNSFSANKLFSITRAQCKFSRVPAIMTVYDEK